mmetsp:Transcript_101044/g.314240  ORF Transcript_101044/g.314240 Transcript_101044/m.314240 type:complete len:422 (+) Transcript_101044:1-1266(+)
MNDPLTVGGAVLGVMLYRRAMRSQRLQEYLHSQCSSAALLCQYYVLYFAVILWLLLLTGNYIFLYDSPILLTAGEMEASLNRTLRGDFGMNGTEADAWAEQLGMDPQLLAISRFCPLAVLLTFAVSLLHVRQLCVEDVTGLPWFPAYRQDLVIQVVILPPLYAAMSLRNVVRLWSVMLGSDWYGGHGDSELAWAEFVDYNIGIYKCNFAVANFAEMYAVWCFSKLCLNLLKDSISSKDVRLTLSRVTMQGVHAFVLIGFAKTVVELWLYHLAATPDAAEPPPGDTVARLLDAANATQVNDFLHVLLLLASVQCLYNMTAICWMPQLVDINPSAKFFGTGILVVFAQLQSFFLESASACYHSWFQYSLFQARLLHAALMCWECLGVAVLLVCAWPPEDYEQGYLSFRKQEPALDEGPGAGPR